MKATSHHKLTTLSRRTVCPGYFSGNLALCAAAFLYALPCDGQITGLVSQGYSESTYALDSEGVLFAWGRNESGQLGSGTNRNQVIETYPQWVPIPTGVTNWTAVAGGTSCTFALDQSGRLFSCGDNTFRQLGLGNVGVQGLLQPIPFPSGVASWTAVSGGNGTLAISDAGALFGWGALGFTNLNYVDHPIPIPLPSTALSVAAGRSHFMVLAADGKLRAWGQNDAGQTGVGYASGQGVTNVTEISFPVGVTRWLAVVGGGFHSLGLGDDNNLYAWGANNFGQLGIGSSAAVVPTLTMVAFPTGVTSWKQVAAGEYHSAALAGNGRLYSWGRNINGMLGTGSTTNEVVPVEIVRPASVVKWLAVTAGRLHTMALADDGHVYSWGYGEYGILGNGTTTLFQTTPTPVLFRPTMLLSNSSPAIELRAKAPSGSRWVLESSSGLISWSPSTTNTAHQGEASFPWTNSRSDTRRYFRLLQDSGVD